MKIFRLIVLLAFPLLCVGALSPQDGFSSVQCGSDIPKALIGKAMKNESAEKIEARHKNLGLKDLGSSDISDKLFALSWRICGDEYMLLQDSRDIVRDVIKIPEHSKQSPMSVGECKANGAKIPTVVAILNNEEGKAGLSAKSAWKIDSKTSKFIKLPVEGLSCSRDGIITADGGH